MTMKKRAPGFETLAIHAGQEPDLATGATIVPIYQTSTFTQHGIGGHKGFQYARSSNPTRSALEKCLASLEGASFGLAFSSGMAAISAVLSTLRPGDHVVASADIYGGTYRLFEKVCKPQGLDFTYADGRDPGNFARALGPKTRLAWIETPTNPLLSLADISAISGSCRAKGVKVAVDNTFASPYFQKPLALGADIVVHSTTKYVGGHSDVVGGAMLTSVREVYDAVKFHQNAAGGVPGPFDAWLTLRGLKTLAIRMKRHAENALAVAEHLSKHPAVESVIYPGLSSHPQHDLARRQMTGFGGMVTFRVKGARPAADAFFKALKVFSFAESLGGVESLVCHPATMTHSSFPASVRERLGITEGTVRLSVGIEDAADLVADLDAAFSAAG
ncbi:MAG: cystathionine gamma-synthase [Elusimicrobia bacterium]|nr:cystathionine gamma-synthase [Elusimicrobiota bacterium]